MRAAAMRRSSRSSSWHWQGRETHFPVVSTTRTKPTPSQMGQVFIHLRLAHGLGPAAWGWRGKAVRKAGGNVNKDRLDVKKRRAARGTGKDYGRGVREWTDELPGPGFTMAG